MEEPLQLAEAVRQACIAAALWAYEDAGLSGLCQEGRWEYAVYYEIRGSLEFSAVESFEDRLLDLRLCR